MKYEARGVECLGCTALDLRTHPEQAKGGFGICRIKGFFVAFTCARNCADYEAAPDEVTNAREAWNSQRPTTP
jgi:hypothetical protein